MHAAMVLMIMNENWSDANYTYLCAFIQGVSFSVHKVFQVFGHKKHDYNKHN